MSWITIGWSAAASTCLTLATVHLLIWCKQTGQWAHLLFAVTATSVAAVAACELLLMGAQTPQQFGRVVWWAHLPLFFAVVSIVSFVRLDFRAGRPWLGYAACGLRLLDLIINLWSVPNVNYTQITVAAVELEGRLGVTRAPPGVPIGAVGERVGDCPVRIGQEHRRAPGVKMVLSVHAALLRADQPQSVDVVSHGGLAAHGAGARQGPVQRAIGVNGVAGHAAGRISHLHLAAFGVVPISVTPGRAQPVARVAGVPPIDDVGDVAVGPWVRLPSAS